MKKLLIGIMILIVNISFAWAKDYKTPHVLNSGELLSSDVFNENFDEIRKIRQSIQQADLLGVWECTAYRKYADGEGFNPANPWVLSDDGLLYTSPVVSMEFSATTFTPNDGTGHYPFHRSNLSPCTWTVRANTFYFKDSTNRVRSYRIEKTSDSRVTFSLLEDKERLAPDVFYPGIVICDKTSVPPDKAEVLTAIAAGATVTLMWFDVSADETGYKIYRKTAIDGAWVLRATVAANTAEFSESVLTAESVEYWYRVVPFNKFGEGIGSNVVLVEVAK